MLAYPGEPLDELTRTLGSLNLKMTRELGVETCRIRMMRLSHSKFRIQQLHSIHKNNKSVVFIQKMYTRDMLKEERTKTEDLYQ